MRLVDGRTGLRVLDRDECLTLLAGAQVGRFAVVAHGRPMIYPVNFALDGEDVVFRSDAGTKVDAGQRAPVCFEVDHLDPENREGWSVVVTGRLEEAIPHPRDAWQRLVALQIEPWAGPKERVFRIVPDRITGRRVAPRS